MITLPANVFRPLLLWAALLVYGAAPAAGQIINFQPLARGEFEEKEEELQIIRGIEVSGDYAGRIAREKHEDIPNGEAYTRFKNDIRLHANTIFHRDVSLHLVLEPLPAEVADSPFRAAGRNDSEHVADAQALTLSAREAYLKYRFNPRSAFIVGTQEIAIGDRRGKVFHGIAPAITFDCTAGTWCMPFGGIKIGDNAGDWIFHWALEYTAWNDENGPYTDTLQVEVFRILYAESNVPLGRNRGPGLFNRDDPDNPSNVDASQAVDSAGYPIYYSATAQNFFGVRGKWDSGPLFLNFDLTLSQGRRTLKRYADFDRAVTPQPLTLGGDLDFAFAQSLSGVAWETEVGLRYPTIRLGLRVMSASGDPPLDEGDTAGLANDLNGYYEINPGAYRGTRVFFNGQDFTPRDGAGLGHSVNNTRMYGFFLDYSDPDGRGMEYSLGLFKIDPHHPVRDVNGIKRTGFAFEASNRLAFYLHKAVKWEFEANFMDTGLAFAVDPYTTPSADATEFFLQGITRLTYQF